MKTYMQVTAKRHEDMAKSLEHVKTSFGLGGKAEGVEAIFGLAKSKYAATAKNRTMEEGPLDLSAIDGLRYALDSLAKLERATNKAEAMNLIWTACNTVQVKGEDGRIERIERANVDGRKKFFADFISDETMQTYQYHVFDWLHTEEKDGLICPLLTEKSATVKFADILKAIDPDGYTGRLKYMLAFTSNLAYYTAKKDSGAAVDICDKRNSGDLYFGYKSLISTMGWSLPLNKLSLNKLSDQMSSAALKVFEGLLNDEAINSLKMNNQDVKFYQACIRQAKIKDNGRDTYYHTARDSALLNAFWACFYKRHGGRDAKYAWIARGFTTTDSEEAINVKS